MDLSETIQTCGTSFQTTKGWLGKKMFFWLFFFGGGGLQLATALCNAQKQKIEYKFKLYNQF